MKITALSSCCVDFFPEQGKVYVGGNSLNFASQCKLSGIEDVTVIGAIGKDDFGALIEQHFDKIKIDRSHIYQIDKPTASNKIFIDKNGDRYFKEDSWNGGAFDAFRLADNDWKQVEKSDIIAMPAGDPNLKDLLNKRNDSQWVVIDFMDYFTLDIIESLIEKIDITFLSAKENMLDDLSTLAKKKGKLIVATLGAKGSIAFWNNSSYRHKAIEVDKIIDTTGCGDAFQAAFTIEFFKSRNINEALKIASVAASKVLAYMGGVE
ncbi:MAG: carbohydrate kinase family protein [Bacteroidetes bacterium]|nr:carbohydrate kinase family protein [Bacteroidota bacterium]